MIVSSINFPSKKKKSHWISHNGDSSKSESESELKSKSGFAPRTLFIVFLITIRMVMQAYYLCDYSCLTHTFDSSVDSADIMIGIVDGNIMNLIRLDSTRFDSIRFDRKILY